MSSLHFPRQHRSGAMQASSGRLSFAALLVITIASAATGAVVALIAQRVIQRQRTIDVLPSPAPIRHLRDHADTLPVDQAPPTPSPVSPLGVVATKLSASRTAELELLVADDIDVIAGDGSLDCPADFPIKGNGRSGIYHWPGSLNYPQTHPTLCFRTTDAADNAGFRPATR